MNELGDHVRTACIWEATARKAGNVHRLTDFDGLSYVDFVGSALAIAPVMERMAGEPLGATILEAIRATRAVVQTNTNLGIVLLLAPLSKCQPAPEIVGHCERDVGAIIETTSIDDARNVYEAIRLAVPGGMGKVDQQDIAGEPTLTLTEVMALAADRDLIARQYANGFRDVLREGLPALLAGLTNFGNVEAAILVCQLHCLSHFPDSLIARKRGIDEANEVMRRAQAIDLKAPDGWQRFMELDRWLRSEGHSRNPGTTADLVTACLFVALREHRIALSTPFNSGFGRNYHS
jgi:triphosphoribosyl-dephospho-CoA synthase